MIPSILARPSTRASYLSKPSCALISSAASIGQMPRGTCEVGTPSPHGYTQAMKRGSSAFEPALSVSVTTAAPRSCARTAASTASFVLPEWLHITTRLCLPSFFGVATRNSLAVCQPEEVLALSTVIRKCEGYRSIRLPPHATQYTSVISPCSSRTFLITSFAFMIFSLLLQWVKI